MVLENETLEEMLEAGHARRMGHIENYFAILQRQKLYKTFSVVARFNTKVNNKALLFHALRPLLLKYSTLAATVVDTDYSDTTIPRPIHDYIKVIDLLRLKDFLYELPEEAKSLKDDDLLRELNNIELPYADGNVLWKLAFLDDNTIVYISNHCLSDGITAKNLLQDLENEFERLASEDLPDADYDSKILLNYNSDKQQLAKLPPALDTHVKYAPPFWYFPEYLFNFFFIRFLCFNSGVVKPTDQHQYKTINLSSNEVSALKQRLKENESDKKITLTPFIQAAWLNAQYNSGIFDNSYFKIADFSIPCNARQYLPSGTDQDQFKYGANTSGAHKFFTPVKKLTWAIVGQYNSYIKYLFQTRRFLYNMGILTMEAIAKTKNLDKIVRESFFGVQRGNTLFSNLGLVQDSNNERYRIQDIKFSQNAGALIFNFSICSVASIAGGMNIVVSMAENAVPEKSFDLIMENFRHNLLTDKIDAN